MVRRHLLLLLAVLLIASSLIAAVRVDFDRSVHFRVYRTFDWMEGTPARDPENDLFIRSAIERALADRGLRRDDRAPDLIVVTHAAVGGPWALSPENFRYGGYPEEGWGMLDRGGKAVLIVDILLADSKRLVWRGFATGNMPVDEVKLRRKVDKIVRTMFKKLPV